MPNVRIPITNETVESAVCDYDLDLNVLSLLALQAGLVMFVTDRSLPFLEYEIQLGKRVACENGID
jgi:hypothetical protein